MSRACVFLDRDGVINEKPPRGEYVTRWQDFHILPAAVDWIRLFNALDLLVVVVTNQRGVALGLMTEADLEDIHRRMLESLSAAGARIDRIYYCAHHADTCDCRKPQPGMVLRARSELDIDLARSIMIGDSDIDEELARRCGLKFVRADEGRVTAVAGRGVPEAEP